MENATPNQDCRNCGNTLPEGAKFCPACSQKNTTGRIQLWDLLRDSFEAIFNIDSRFFHTLQAIFIPGKLTIEYFQGRHKRFANPFRLFFVLAIIHFAALSVIVIRETKDDIAGVTERQREAAFRAGFLEELDTIAAELIDSHFVDQPIVAEAYDSLRAEEKARKGNFNLGTGYVYFDDNWSLKTKSIEFQWEEAFRLSEDELLEKYKVNEGLMAQMQVRQMLRVNKEPMNFFRFIFGQMIWMVLVMLLFLALILKLFYVRRNKYYVEHLVFSFHYHAFAFLIATVPILAYNFFPDIISFELLGDLLSAAFIIILIYLYIAMKRVYKQHWFKTFIKYSALNFFYLFIFTVFLTLTFIASALFF